MAAPRKRPRLAGNDDLRENVTMALQHCGRRRMASLLKAASDNPDVLQQGKSVQLNRWFSAAKKKFVRGLSVELEGGSTHDIAVTAVEPFLQELLDSSPRLHRAYETALANRADPAQSWRLVVCFDEYSPGSELQGRHTRKIGHCMLNFMELGVDALRDDDAWLSGLLLRADVKKQIIGKWSRAFRDFLMYLCWSDRGLSTTGVALRVGGQNVLLKARLHAILGDGEGLAEALQWKGAAGLKVCWRHWNVLMLGSGLAEHAAGDFVEASCCDSKRFRVAPLAEQHRAFDMVLEARRQRAENRISKAALDDIEKVVGFAITAEGVLACPQLRDSVLQAARYDWMHCALAGGTLTTDLSLLVSTVPGLGWRRLQEFFQLAWKFPHTLMRHGLGGSLYAACKQSEHSTSGKCKASCSEQLTMYALVRHFVTTCLDPPDDPAVQAALESFKACCEVVDAFLFVKRRRHTGIVYNDIITPKIDEHMVRFAAAYGSQCFLPKHHWLYDCALQIKMDGGVVLDMFVMERTHKKLKSPSEKRMLTQDATAQSLLAARCATHICSESSKRDGDPVEGAAQVPGSVFSAARWMVVSGEEMHVGDVAVNRQLQAVGIITACVSNGVESWAEVDPHILKKRLSEHSTVWASEDTRSVWDASSLQLAQAWYEDASTGYLVVVV